MTLKEKFEQVKRYTTDCIDAPQYFYWDRKRYTSAQVAWFLSRGEWPKGRIYRTCDNPRCVRDSHLSATRTIPIRGFLECWGQRFQNIRLLWEHPRCYVRTKRQLQSRLLKLPPEQAVMPEYWTLDGVKYDSMRKIPRPPGLSLTELYRRLGSYWQISRKTARKFSVKQALDQDFWKNDIPLLRQVGNGYSGSIYREPEKTFVMGDHIIIDGVPYRRFIP